VWVVGEIRNGIERIRQSNGASAGALDSWLAALELTFSEKILPITRAIADRWGALALSDRFQLWMHCWQPLRLKIFDHRDHSAGFARTPTIAPRSARSADRRFVGGDAIELHSVGGG
jgi:hypothetical protein